MKYSIITINYNNQSGLRRTIESVISQTFTDYEYILIDGGSTDGSVDVIKEYKQHINYWVSEKDNGIYNAMNKGIKVAKGDYLNFMNSGDMFYNENVLSIIATEFNDIDILVGKDYHYNAITKKGFSSILPTRISMITFFMETLPHQGAFIKRKLFENDLYDENLSIAADWAFYVKKIVVENCSVKLIPIIVSNREQGGISTSQELEHKNERDTIIHQLLPNGVYHDYKTLSHLDRSTLYKLMNICEYEKACRLLALCIKIINRMFFK
jgi:glycosyltransferase involved in cell wall biosynthesis